MNLVFSKDFEKCLVDISEYYTRQVSEKVTADFYTEVKKVLEYILNFPDGSRSLKKRSAIYRKPIIKFSYFLYYTIEKDTIIILTLRHFKQQTQK